MPRRRNYPLALFSLAFCLLFALSVSLQGQTQFIPKKNLLLIGWDGVQYEHLKELLSAGKLPNLSKLIAEGSFVKISITDHATDTKSGWTQIATGLPAKDSGVFSNREFRPFPKGASIFEKLEALSQGAIFTGFVAGKSHNLGSLGPGVRFEKRRGRRAETSGEGEPWHFAKGSFDLWFGDQQREAREVGEILTSMLVQYGRNNPFAIFAHFADPDSAGHKFGENSAEYEQAIIACDEWLGITIKTLQRLNLLRKTLIVVTTDHGFDEGQKSHKNAPVSFFAINDKSRRYSDGDMKEIAPTILELLEAAGKPASGSLSRSGIGEK